MGLNPLQPGTGSCQGGTAKKVTGLPHCRQEPRNEEEFDGRMLAGWKPTLHCYIVWTGCSVATLPLDFSHDSALGWHTPRTVSSSLARLASMAARRESTWS